MENKCERTGLRTSFVVWHWNSGAKPSPHKKPNRTCTSLQTEAPDCGERTTSDSNLPRRPELVRGALRSPLGDFRRPIEFGCCAELNQRKRGDGNRETFDSWASRIIISSEQGGDEQSARWRGGLNDDIDTKSSGYGRFSLAVSSQVRDGRIAECCRRHQRWATGR